MARSDASVIPRTPRVGVVSTACIAVACIVVIDAGPALAPGTDPFVTKLDDLAHVATAIIVALLLRLGPTFTAALIAGSVAIDADHMPDVLGWDVPNGGAARPYHSLAAVALLLAFAALAPRARSLAAGLAVGIAAHLWRDLATGPGIPLIWPISAAAVRLPYSVYACSVAAAVVLVAVRTRRQSESASH